MKKSDFYLNIIRFRLVVSSYKILHNGSEFAKCDSEEELYNFIESLSEEVPLKELYVQYEKNGKITTSPLETFCNK